MRISVKFRLENMEFLYGNDNFPSVPRAGEFLSFSDEDDSPRYEVISVTYEFFKKHYQTIPSVWVTVRETMEEVGA